MNENLISNPEIKNNILKIFIIFVIITICALLYMNFFWSRLNKTIINNNIAVIGNVINKHPELKDDIVSSFTKGINDEELKKGIDAAQKYGYTNELPVTVTPIIKDFYIKSIYGEVIVLTIFLILFIIIMFFSYYSIYHRINRIVLASEKIVEGDFSIKFESESEGLLSKLEHQFSQMSKRLELSFEALRNGKIFLKNMISDISHQLKTPLSSIKMFNELMDDKNIQDEDRIEFIKRSGIQIERMEWLIKNLLKLARIEAGAIEFNNEKAPILKTINNALSSLEYKRREKGININVSGNCNIIFSHDIRWLSESLGNIIKNSLEHTNQGGHIEIALYESPVMIRITFKDDGEGISKEDLPHIFERFYRGKNNVHRTGTGIGLALAKSIIENEGGMISVKSEVGIGTEFTVTFIKGIV